MPKGLAQTLGLHRKQSDPGPATSLSSGSHRGEASTSQGRQGRRPAVSRVQGDSGTRWSQWLVGSRKVQNRQLAHSSSTQLWLSIEDRRGELTGSPA